MTIEPSQPIAGLTYFYNSSDHVKSIIFTYYEKIIFAFLLTFVLTGMSFAGDFSNIAASGPQTMPKLS